MAHTAKKPNAVKKPVKTAGKPQVSKRPAKAAEPKKVAAEKPTGLVASVLGVDGKVTGKVTLPAELFAVKVNKALLAQAVRVYLANQREGGAKTKTRGEVEGSTRKIYKQKGTGRARHGGIRAPIFVGGGRAFGPRIHSFALNMNKGMKRASLSSALTQKYNDGELIVMDGLETLGAKTKPVARALSTVRSVGTLLLVVPHVAPELGKAARNIEKVTILPAIDLHPYAVLTHSKILITKNALEEAKKHFI